MSNTKLLSTTFRISKGCYSAVKNHLHCHARYLATAPASQEKQKELSDESTSFVTNLFKGQAKMEQIFPFPEVLTAEQNETMEALVDPATRFFQSHDATKCEKMETVIPESVNGLRQLGAFGVQVPMDFGGLGLNNIQYARIADIMGHFDLGVGVFLGAHQAIGLKGILIYGNDYQKQKYLPELASGEKFAAYCLTEPSCGSDASAIKTRAVLAPSKDHYIMNGSKIWISNGGIADVFTVFAKTPVTTPQGEVDKVTAFIVERGFGGVTSGQPEKKMGIKCSNTAEIFFDDVKIPVENVLGEVGNGFKVAMNILNAGRFGMSAALSGTMRMAIARATEHATNRNQFGNKISTYGTIQEKLARMAMLQYIAESMAFLVASNMDRGFTDFQLEAAISKVFASEAAWFVVDEAIQILGGMGFMQEAGLEKVLRDTRIFRIFEGTNDILKLFVALTGLQHAGSHLKELQKAMKNPAANLGLIFDEGARRVKRVVGISGGTTLTEHVHSQLQPSAAQLSKCIDLFGSSVEQILMKHGKNVINEQFLLNCLARAAVDIFSMAVVLSRSSRALQKGLPSAAFEQNLTTVICREASERVQNQLGAFKSSEKLDSFERMKFISEDICSNGGLVQSHPLGY